MSDRKWYLRTQDETFGPETGDTLVNWAKMGRIQPGQEISDDNVIWTKVEEVPFLDMRFSIDIGDGNPRGPFNKAAADALIASGRLPSAAKVIETRAPFEIESNSVEVESDNVDANPTLTDSNPTLNDPNERVVEKVVEVPVEKIVEKIVEVPVEKIVEKTVTVVDDTRIRELEAMLEEERGRFAVLQAKADESSKTASELRGEIARLEGELKNAAEEKKRLEGEFAQQHARSEAEKKSADEKFEKAARDAVDREAKLREQVAALEDELRRLPQAASEVAEIQASMFALMTKEAGELETLIAAEKAELDEFVKRCETRADRMRERRREILKRAGNNIEEMTRKSLIECPEDPRTAQLRRELEELRRADEKKTLDAMARIRDLEAQLKDYQELNKRAVEGGKDVTQLRRENQALQERLQACERELLAQREQAESLRLREAANKQAMVNRLKTLESPALGMSVSASSNQSREAKQVKIPRWMRFGGK